MRLVTSGSQREATQNFTVAARGRRENVQLVTLGYTGSTKRGTCSAELSVVFDQGESVMIITDSVLKIRVGELSGVANSSARRHALFG